MKFLFSLLVIVLCAALGLALAAAMLHLPAPSVHLAAEVDARLGSSGVTHPVTAVLLNFRGYDTLLEVAVLLLALFGVLSVGADAGGQQRIRLPGQHVLQAMARLLAPVMLLVAVYLLWAGAHRPGGAFQAAAVLSAAGVLLYLAGLPLGAQRPALWLRTALVAGFLLFAAIAGLAGNTLLHYPARHAGLLILLIETGLSLSLGLVLAALFLWLPDEQQENGQ